MTSRFVFLTLSAFVCAVSGAAIAPCEDNVGSAVAAQPGDQPWFRDATKEYGPIGGGPPAFADLDGDGYPDLVCDGKIYKNDRGKRFIDAPVVYGASGAREGTLLSLCGGSEEDVERARPVLMAYSRNVLRVGPVGAGQLAKACNNLLHWVHCVSNFETLLLAKRFGVDAAQELVPGHMTLGDVDSPEALEEYQAAKRAYKSSLRDDARRSGRDG